MARTSVPVEGARPAHPPDGGPAADARGRAAPRLGAGAGPVPPARAEGAEPAVPDRATPGGPDRAAPPRLPGGRYHRSLAATAARRRAEAGLRRRDEQLADTEGLAGMGHWERDLRTGAVRWSDGMFRLFGLPPTEAPPTFERFLALVHRDDRGRVEQVVADAVATRSAFSLEHRALLPTGELRWVHGRGKVVLDAAGAPARLRGTAQDVTERHVAEQALQDLALHDVLTGLPNRALFIDRLGQALRQLRRREARLAVLFIDVDRFKAVNDSYGHAAGDQVLVALSSRLGEVLRPGDTLARFAGDEFTALCTDVANDASAVVIAERILAAMDPPVILDDGRQAFVTASVGVAVAGAGDSSADDVLSNADSAMYQAKERGRNRIELFDQAMRAEVVARARHSAALRRAVGGDELCVHYQPEVRLADESVAGVEALVRWQHPERGLLGPADFLAVAEDTGVVVALGAQVLRTACRDAGALSALSSPRPIEVAVNVSTRQLVEPGVVAMVEAILEETGMEPSRLCLEITESVLLEDLRTSVGALVDLRAFGVRVAIDDFGTGYSSLGYLRQVPVDVVKIDRSFVAGLGADSAAEAIVAAVVNLAHALGLSVVAEGVETDEQLVVLRALGCDRAHGHLWSRALPLADLRRWRPDGDGTGPAVDLRPVLVERTDVVRHATGRAMLLQLPGTLPAAEADGVALKTVVDHLLSNAVTFSPAERPVVLTAGANRRWVRFSVADFGIGMTGEEVARCFEQFWQAEAGAPYRRGGTGIGLSSVRSLVEGMGGRVSVRSAPGKGSTFTVLLRRVNRPVPTAPVPGIGEASMVREFMRQIGVPTRRER